MRRRRSRAPEGDARSALSEASTLSMLVIVAVTMLVGSGCFSKKPADKHRYLLGAVATPAAEPASAAPIAAEVKLERVRVSPLYDSKGFVYRTGGRRYETAFYHEFYAAPGVVFEEALLESLRGVGTFEAVRAAQDPGPAALLLAVRIDELYADVRDRAAPKAVIALTVELRDPSLRGPGVLMMRSYSAATPIAGSNAEQLLDGWSTGLASVLAEAQSDMRALDPPLASSR